MIYNSDFSKTYAVSQYGNPYYFTGRRMDSFDSHARRLGFYRNRYLDYHTGRWLSHDPLGITPNPQKPNEFEILNQYNDGTNLYEYVDSQPIIHSDIYGLCGQCGECQAPALRKYHIQGKWFTTNFGVKPEYVGGVKKWAESFKIIGAIGSVGSIGATGAKELVNGARFIYGAACSVCQDNYKCKGPRGYSGRDGDGDRWLVNVRPPTYKELEKCTNDAIQKILFNR